MRAHPHHRRDEAVAPARDIGDVPLSRAAIAKRLAQGGDVDPQSVLLDDRVRPGASDELVLADRLAGAFNQRDENVQRPAAEAQRLSVLEQHALGGNEAKRAEGEGFFIHRGRPQGDFHFILTEETFRNATAGYPSLLRRPAARK